MVKQHGEMIGNFFRTDRQTDFWLINIEALIRQIRVRERQNNPLGLIWIEGRNCPLGKKNKKKERIRTSVNILFSDEKKN